MGFGDKPRYNQNQRKQEPRKPLGGVHEIDPIIESVLTQFDRIQDLLSEGSEMSSEIIRFNTPDGQGVSMEAYKAMLMFRLTFAVPITNKAYPNILKFNTNLPRNSYHPQYRSRIFWEHDEGYWHIPCYTRYVINAHGHVKNAYNGMDLLPNQWGSLSLVPDRNGMGEKALQVNLPDLMMLAFKPLPADFVDYGSRYYSHVLGYNKDTKSMDWIERPSIVVRDQMGSIAEGRNCREFSNSNLKGDAAKGFAMQLKEHALVDAPQEVAGMTVKLKDDALIVPRTAVAVAVPQAAAPMQPQVQAAAPMQPAPQAAPVAGFDEDIPF